MPACTLLPRVGLAALFFFALQASAPAADIEQPPINYSLGKPDNVVTRLQEKLDAGKSHLEFDDDHGYLASVLRELDVPLSSQVFVFSKTSLQRQRIAPKTPRAIYFNDDVYVGFCRHGEVMEVSAVDPSLGTVFYTLDRQPTKRPYFNRQTDNCLLCHASTLTHNYPGHLVRSVYPDEEGNPVFAMGSIRVDQATPLADRWGGWYVSGSTGRQTHRGNLILSGRSHQPRSDLPERDNVDDLRPWFSVADYLSPHSDVVALMVLEHQTELHNRIIRANFETRLALYQQAEFDRFAGHKTEGLSESTVRRVKSACEPLVRYLLFCEEAKLTDKVSGPTTFAEEFAARGPGDQAGRSLREFDLERRLFKYPCSYLIYSRAFDGLPKEAKDYVYRRLGDVLTGKDSSPDFAHLTADDRRAVLDILLDTKPDLPNDWKRR